MAKTTDVFVYARSGTLFEGVAASVSLPSETGALSILPEHCPLVTSLTRGVIRVAGDDGERTFPIESGFAYVDQKSVLCLVTGAA